MERSPRVPRLAAVEEVRCLECGVTYAKPQGGGTVQENPGCPLCGYLGWISAAIPVTPLGSEHPHHAEGQLPRRAARAH